MESYELKLIELKGEKAELDYRIDNEPDNSRYLKSRLENVKTQIEEIEKIIESYKKPTF